MSCLVPVSGLRGCASASHAALHGLHGWFALELARAGSTAENGLHHRVFSEGVLPLPLLSCFSMSSAEVAVAAPRVALVLAHRVAAASSLPTAR